MMTTTTGQNYDKNITGFKPFFVITFLVGMVLVGMTPVLVPSYILSVTGSATDLALMLSLMTLGAFAVPLLAGAADKYRSHRLVQSLSLLAASGYAILGFT